MTEKEITYQIRGAIYDTYRALGPGLLESVYEEVLVYFLQKRGLFVERQVSLPIEVDGIVLNSPLRIDLLVEFNTMPSTSIGKETCLLKLMALC